MVMAGVFPGQGAAVVQHRLTAVVWEPAQIDNLESAAHAAGLRAGTLPVHLEIDTGMSRQGAGLDDLAPLLARFSPDSPLKLEGIMTHLYAADEADGSRHPDPSLPSSSRPWPASRPLASIPIGSASAARPRSSAPWTDPIVDLAARHGMKAMLRPGLALYGVTPASTRPSNPASRRRSPPRALNSSPCSPGKPPS